MLPSCSSPKACTGSPSLSLQQLRLERQWNWQGCTVYLLGLSRIQRGHGAAVQKQLAKRKHMRGFQQSFRGVCKRSGKWSSHLLLSRSCFQLVDHDSAGKRPTGKQQQISQRMRLQPALRRLLWPSRGRMRKTEQQCRWVGHGLLAFCTCKSFLDQAVHDVQLGCLQAGVFSCWPPHVGGS